MSGGPIKALDGFSSSREVYSQQDQLLVKETAELRPMNVYACTKCKGEATVVQAKEDGLLANIVRLSNVFGHTKDPPDRVVPAFARAAALGLSGRIQVEGGGNLFDFTHISDVVRGLMRLVQLTSQGRSLAPLHLVSGMGTSLAQLASLAERCSRAAVTVVEGAPRSFDVAQFIG